MRFTIMVIGPEGQQMISEHAESNDPWCALADIANDHLYENCEEDLCPGTP